MKKIILVFLGCMVAILLHAQTAYDFMVPNSDGIRLYYKITDTSKGYVMLTTADGEVNPQITDKYGSQMTNLGIDTFNVPATVMYGGNQYSIKMIASYVGQSLAGGEWKIVFPEGLTTLKTYSLTYLSGFKSIYFPSTLETVGGSSFTDISSYSLSEVTLDLSRTKVTTLIDAFGGMNDAISKIIFPETLTSLGLIGLIGLKELTLPAAVNSLAYSSLMNLEILRIKNATPPTTASSGLSFPKIKKIFVPADAATAYSQAEKWSNFAGKYYGEVTIGASGYASYYLVNDNFEVPAGCTAYVITEVKKESGQYQAKTEAFAAGSIIPAGQAVILKGTAGQTYAYKANLTGTPVTIAKNLLVGTATEQTLNAAGYKYFLFGSGPDGQGFYRQTGHDINSIHLKAHKAGLRLPSTAIGSAKSFVIDFSTPETTGIRSVGSAVQPSKEDVYFDLQGRRVLHPTRGIYIVNGKKVVKE